MEKIGLLEKQKDRILSIMTELYLIFCNSIVVFDKYHNLLRTNYKWSDKKAEENYNSAGEELNYINNLIQK